MQRESYNIIYFDEISTEKITPNSKLYHIISKEESEKILENYESTDNILTIYHPKFEKENDNNDNNKNYYNKRFPNLNRHFYYLNTMIFYPTRIEPSTIDMTNYMFERDENTIIKVTNNKDGNLVKFKEIIEEKKKSNKNLQFFIYYSIFNRNVYIIHSHILDKDLINKKIDMKIIDYKTDYHKLKKDINYINKDLMLLLIRSLKPFRLYYKGKKIQMDSKNIINNNIYQIKNNNLNKTTTSIENMYVKIENIPHYIINSETNLTNTKNEINEFCDYNFYEKPAIHGVDIKILLESNNQPIDEDISVAVPPCFLKELEQNEQMLVEKTYNNRNKVIGNNEEPYEIQRYNLINKKLLDFEKYCKDENLVKNMNDIEFKKNLFTLNDYKNSFYGISNYIQNNELWEYIEGIDICQNKLDELINLFNKYKK